MAKGYKQLWADLEAREITQTAALVYCWLQGRRNGKDELRIAASEIGEAIGLNRHTVGRALRELIGRNYLTEKTYHGQHERVLNFGTGGTQTAKIMAPKQPTTWHPNSQDHGTVPGCLSAMSSPEKLEAQVSQSSLESLYPLRGDVGGALLGSAPHQNQEKKESAKNFVGAFLGAMGIDDASK